MKKLLYLQIYEDLLTTFMTEKIYHVYTGFPLPCGLRVKWKSTRGLATCIISLSSPQLYEVGTIIPILQKGKLRFRRVK